MSQPLNFPYATTSVANAQRQNQLPLVIAVPKGTPQPISISYPLPNSMSHPTQNQSSPSRVTTIPVSHTVKPITIQFPQKFPYETDHQVPWNYNLEAAASTGERIEPEVAEIGGMTRSGRVNILW